MFFQFVSARAALAAIAVVVAIGGLSLAWGQQDDPFGGDPFGGDPFGTEPPVDDRDPFDDRDPLGREQPDPMRDIPDPFGGGDADPFGGGDDPFGGNAPAPPLPEPKPQPQPQHIKLPERKYAASDERVRAALAKDTVLEFIETPLQDVADYLAELHEINIELDQRAMEEIGIGSDTPVTRNLKNVSLRSALRHVLPELDLTYIIRDGVLVITTPEAAESEENLITRVYPVAGLLDEPDPLVDALVEAGYEVFRKDLTATIRRVARPTMWIDVGGPGSIKLLHETLVVHQTEEVHDEIASLLADLKQGQAAAGKTGRSTPELVSLPQYAGREAEIVKALAKPVSFEFLELPLADVADHFEEHCGVSIEIDHMCLEEVGIGTDTPVTLKLKDVSLEAALRLILKPMDLTFAIRDEVLLITTPEEEESRLATRVYPVADLVHWLDDPQFSLIYDLEQTGDYDSLIDLVTSLLRPTTWEEVGGPGAIDACGPCECIVISQTYEVHNEVEALLTGLRRLRAQQQKEPARTLTQAVPLDEMTDDGRVKLRAALARNAGMLAFKDTPLTEVVDALSAKHGVAIKLDAKALEEIGIDPAAQMITATLQAQTLAQALRQMLRPLQLTWALDNEVIMITSPEEAESELVEKIYPVRDLVLPPDADAADESAYDFDSLIDAIQNTIRPTFWENVGGPGVIEPCPVVDAIVVSQTEEIHEEIAGMLAQVRRVRQDQSTLDAPRAIGAPDSGGGAQPAGEAKPAGPLVNKQGERLYLKIYRLSSEEREDARDLAETIRELIEPENWSAEEHYYLRPLAGALVIRHTAATHRKIHKLLVELDAIEWPLNLGTGGNLQPPVGNGSGGAVGGPPVVGRAHGKSGLGAALQSGGVF